MKKAQAFILSIILFAVASVAGAPISAAKDDRASALAGQVKIRRDTYGVPHILAETEEAAAFGMGYAQAEDHAVEIARRLLAARGEEAKYTGAGIDNDFFVKRFGVYQTGRDNFDKLNPLFQKMLHAYAAGFNRYVEKHRSEMPAWIPDFDGYDVLARGRWEVFRFAFNRGNIITALQQKYPADAKAGAIDERVNRKELAAYLSEANDESDAMEGSNLWALAGSRTTTGKPILLGNPHQSWSVLYWEAHVTVPGKLNFYGSTFVGRPVLTSGFNEHLGWTHTVNNIDLEDIYALTLDASNPDHYVFDGKSMALAKKEFTVEIKNPDGSMRTERQAYWYSHLGPVVHQTADKAFAIKSPIFDEVRSFEEWYELGKAKNWSQFYSTMKMNLLPMFNVGYADADGNIFYLWNGLVPKRVDDGTDYRLDVPGANGKYVWSSLHPTEELPQLKNPAGGYVQNCNDAPWWTTLRALIDPKKYPSYIEPGITLGLRSQMSLEMLESQSKFSLQDVMRLKFNPRMLVADRVKPDLIKAVKESSNPSEDLKRGLAALEAWDNRVAPESRGAVLFQRFWDMYRSETKQPFAVEWDAKNPAKTPYGLSNTRLALRQFEYAVRWVRERYGTESVAWGDVHRIRLGDVDLPASGAIGTYGLFHVVGFQEQKDGKRVIGTAEKGRPMVGGGDGWIFAVEFSRPLKAYSLLAYSNTSNADSKHHTQQARMFARGEMKRVFFTEAEIKANLEREYRP